MPLHLLKQFQRYHVAGILLASADESVVDDAVRLQAFRLHLNKEVQGLIQLLVLPTSNYLLGVVPQGGIAAFALAFAATFGPSSSLRHFLSCLCCSFATFAFCRCGSTPIASSLFAPCLACGAAFAVSLLLLSSHGSRSSLWSHHAQRSAHIPTCLSVLISVATTRMLPGRRRHVQALRLCCELRRKRRSVVGWQREGHLRR
mmetsp:Transcript_33171/g.77597  ORF Transcript_33171/g.77597 Transcript_33171/m.77597 type:complete len:202 (-) Transcript_33171:252-857(-)